ncbi:uncharacterized protein LOC143450532 isoform X2 [Clavelina lepadiformis]|uniref:uncharacterized protein LOC143450532 isoform X2 n=1 Tax=Clavelina lepadiformis TaxID=159417 RepID=UPI004042810B
MNLTVLLVLTATLLSCHGMPAAPSSLAISGVTSESFTAIFDSVSSATSYEVSYTAQHDSTNTGSVNITANFTTVTGLASNLNYDVRVRAFLSDVAGNYSTAVRARTAPSGSSILQVITTPTYITVFLEETPGATKWEVEYSDGGSTSTIIVPDDVPSMTNYIAIISSLLPNTSYTLRARVSQINGDTNYNVSQSPYGSPTEITTDKVSAFGRVQLISRSYTSTDNTNTTLKTEIATEFLNAYQSVASNVVDVSVVELENGSGNILCHHEIVLNDQTSTPIISALTLSDSALYNGSSVRFDVGESFIVEKFEDGFDIQYADRTPCPGSLSPSRVWTLYDKNGNISSTELPNPDNNIVGVSTVTFADTGFTSSSTILLTFSQNTIYGIKQEYLIKTCPDGDDSTLYYNRVHGSNGAFTNVEANKYTIINTTNVQSIGSITYTTAASGTEVTLNVPANLIQRAFQYNFDVAGLVTTLSQSDLDSSTTYLVSLTGLPQNADSEVTMEVRARGANSSNSNASRIVTVTTERSLAWIAAIVVPVLAIILIVIIIIKCRKVKGAYDPKQVNKNTTLDMSTLQANEQNSQNTRSNVKGFYDLVHAQKQLDSNAGQYCTSVQGNDADVEANSRHSKKGSYDLVEAQRQFDLNRGRYKTYLEDFDADDKVKSPSSKKDSNDPEQTNKNTASNVSGSYDLVEAQKQFDLNAGQYRSFQQGNDVDVVVNSHRSQKGSYDLVEAQRQFDLNRGRYKTCLEDFDADEQATTPSSKDTLDSGVENLAFDRADESLDSGMESEQSDESNRNSSRKGSYDVLGAQQRFNMGTKQQTKDSSIKQQTAIKPGSSPKNNGDETDSERSGKGFYDLLKAQKEFNHGEGSSEYFSHPDQRRNTPHQGEQAEHVVKKGSYDVLKAQQDFNLQISDSVERNFHPDDKEVAVNE